MTKKLQQQLAYAFGVAFVVALLVLAFLVPDPTPFQYIIFRVVLALAVAGVAATIPGFLEVTVSDWLRAGGALAVFVVVYFNNPASLVAPKIEPDPTAMFPIVLACKTPHGVVIDSYSFPYSDIEKNSNYDALKKLIAKLPSQKCAQTESLLFRMRDEKPVLQDGDTSAISSNNIGVIVLPKEVVEELGDNHVAFTWVHSHWNRIKTR